MRLFVTIAAVVFIAPLANPCEDVAVVSHDAKYMLLDGETLATRDVGNLRWMGIWKVDSVLPGSTSARFSFLSDSLSAELAIPDDSGHFQRSALVVVENLAERDNTASRIAISHNYEFPWDSQLWIEGTDQLIGVTDQLVGGTWKRSRVTILDEELNKVDAWSAVDWDAGPGEPILACRRGDDLFVATGTSRTVRRKGETIVDRLAIPDAVQDCRVENRYPRSGGVESPSVGCRGTLGCRRDGRYVRAVVDIADNKVGAWHESQRSAKLLDGNRAGLGVRTYLSSVVLFAGGNKLLRQQSIWIPDPAGPNAFRTIPGPLLQTVDLQSGQVLKENPSGLTGTVSRVFCRGMAERTVLSGDRQVHLIDLNTLEPIASVQIPFDRPFVF